MFRYHTLLDYVSVLFRITVKEDNGPRSEAQLILCVYATFTEVILVLLVDA